MSNSRTTGRRRAPCLFAALLTLAGCGGAGEDANAGNAKHVFVPPPPKAVPSPTTVPTPPARPKGPIPDALDALHRGDGAAAVGGLEAVLRTGSKEYDVDGTARSWLPYAYVVKGDLDAAARRAEEVEHGAPRDIELSLRMLRGDIECVRGATDAAVAIYKSVSSMMSPAEREESAGYTILLEVDIKLGLVGKTLPDPFPVWVVGKGRVEIAGHVAVLSYFSPFVPDMGVMSMARRFRALRDPPLFVGVVPTTADQERFGNPELPEEDWIKPDKTTQEAVLVWRKTNSAEFPVVGVLPSAVPPNGLLFHCDVIVDETGRVAYVSTQSDPDGTMELAVVRRLMSR